MNVLPKVGVSNTSAEDIASFRSENVKLACEIHTNDFFFKGDVGGISMHA